eukprot:20374_1
MSAFNFIRCMNYDAPQIEETYNQKIQNHYIKQQRLDHELKEILRSNDLYTDLYQILRDNNIDLRKLRKIKENNIAGFCDGLSSLNTIKKIKLRKLMRIIINNKPKKQSISNINYKTMQVLLIGDSGVGKTSLLNRYINNCFYVNNNATVNIDCMQKKEILSDETIMRMTIWDTAGQEKYASLSCSYYKKGDCIIICFDVNNKQSFDNCNKWREQIKEFANDDVIIFLVGCKSDLLYRNRLEYEVNAQNIINKKEWSELNTVYCECSAKTNDNVDNVFVTIAELENKKQKRKMLSGNCRKLNNGRINRDDIINAKIGDISDNSCRYTFESCGISCT